MRCKIVTVLRSGGEYTAAHVDRLRAQVMAYAPGCEFICLRDDGIGPYRLISDWPGWWAKMEVFAIPGPVIYMDLDTLIVDRLDLLIRFAETTDFIALQDFYHPSRLGSGLMAWRGDMRHVLDAFAADAENIMATHNRRDKWGDQAFIETMTAGSSFYWQEVLPNSVVSWKAHCRDGGIPPGAKVVCFHGRPRPWEIGL